MGSPASAGSPANTGSPLDSASGSAASATSRANTGAGADGTMFGSDAGSVIELGMYGTSSSESDEEAGGGPARAGHPALTSEYESEYDTEYETETGTGGYDSGEYR